MAGCSWIRGEPHGRATRFCGKPTVCGTAWCQTHYRVVYPHAAAPITEPPEDEGTRDDVEALALGVE